MTLSIWQPMTVSSLINNYKAISDVCLSIPTIVNINGISKNIAINLDEAERQQLRTSVETKKKIIGELDI